jgi:hypothetical protein
MPGDSIDAERWAALADAAPFSVALILVSTG